MTPDKNFWDFEQLITMSHAISGAEKLSVAIQQEIERRAIWKAGNNQKQLNILYEQLVETEKGYIGAALGGGAIIALSSTIGTLAIFISLPPDRSLRQEAGKIILVNTGSLLIGLMVAGLLIGLQKLFSSRRKEGKNAINNWTNSRHGSRSDRPIRN